MNFVSGIDDVTLLDEGFNLWSAWAARPAENQAGLDPIAIGIVSFLCQDKKEKRIQVSKTFLLETFACPSRGKSAFIESFEFLLTFWHCPKK